MQGKKEDGDLNCDPMYSEKYYDAQYEYRHWIIPKAFRHRLPQVPRLLKEHEWRALGIRQTYGWKHYAIFPPEPNVLLFRRPLVDKNRMQNMPIPSVPPHIPPTQTMTHDLGESKDSTDSSCASAEKSTGKAPQPHIVAEGGFALPCSSTQTSDGHVGTKRGRDSCENIAPQRTQPKARGGARAPFRPAQSNGRVKKAKKMMGSGGGGKAKSSVQRRKQSKSKGKDQPAFGIDIFATQ